MSKRYSNKVVSIYDRQPVKGLNKKQNQYINMIKHSAMVLATGASGTGKTHIPSLMAADMLDDPNCPIEKIVICRPNEGPGKSIGFLKGSLHDKMIPWSMPILDAIASRYGGGKIGAERVKTLIEIGTIELLPLEYARGRSYNNSFIICDEMQNCDWESLKNLTLRIGLDTKLVVCGDTRQKDIHTYSGLEQMNKLFDEYHVPWQRIDFTLDDCVRSDTCKFLLGLYETANV